MTLGVDVGGTFTDIVWWDGERLLTAKTPTSVDQSDAVIAGSVELLAGRLTGALLHGTTVATNALLERRGARVSLVTTEGFEDVIEIGRQNRPSLYDPFADRSRPLVERSSRHGLRRLSDGDSWSDRELADLAARVAAGRPDSVAISLLYGYAHPGDEERVAAALPPDVEISRSSVVAPEFREYERATTTIVNAFLAPETGTYLQHLHARVRDAGLPGQVMVMRSSGGLIPIERAAELPVSILLSGPAGGVVAAAAIGELLGDRRLVSFDMGGTSTDVARIDGGIPEVSYERWIEGFPIRMPSVAIHTVGAGGGSVGWIDAGGALRVGPRSAGAHPGPACYGKGAAEPAVTDANLELGRIGGGSRLAGDLHLHPAAASVALGAVGERLGLTGRETARGMVDVVEAHMERAIRKVSVEEGADPRGARLVAFGGAGGLHATALARRLEMAGVIVPPIAGVFSAFGLLLSPPRVDLARSLTVREDTAAALAGRLAELRGQAAGEFFDDTGADPREVRLVADVRYIGQAHETSIPVDETMDWRAVADRFHRAHHLRNGFARAGDPVEIVTIRAAAIGKPTMTIDELPPVRPTGEPVRPRRQVVTSDSGQSPNEVDVWWRPALVPGTELVGPAVVEELEATTFVADGERVRVHETGALEIEW